MMLQKLESSNAILLHFLKIKVKRGTIQNTSLEVDFFELQYFRRYFRRFGLVTKSAHRICLDLLFVRPTLDGFP
jgi:hypothetical protein